MKVSNFTSQLCLYYVTVLVFSILESFLLLYSKKFRNLPKSPEYDGNCLEFSSLSSAAHSEFSPLTLGLFLFLFISHSLQIVFSEFYAFSDLNHFQRLFTGLSCVLNCLPHVKFLLFLNSSTSVSWNKKMGIMLRTSAHRPGPHSALRSM